MSEKRSGSGGMSFLGVLTLIFITLKLLGVIDWSWWWVLSPIWISWSVVLIVIGAVLAGDAWVGRRKRQ